MIVEGVLFSSNAESPALALASEFGAIPPGWDGRPVVYNHPVLNGEAASANRPEAWESEVIGQIFDAELDGVELIANLWLSKDRAPEAVLQGLEAGEDFEVSTGLFMIPEETSGVFRGQSYDHVWRNIVPDHLAILQPGSIGACSLADGCGIRANSKAKFEVYMEQTQGSAGNKNAVAAGAGGCGCQDQPQTLAARVTGMPRAMMNAFSHFMDRFAIADNELSDRDTRIAISTALSSLEGFHYASVEAVYSDTVIFSAMSAEDYEWKMYRVGYSVAEGGAVSLGSEIVSVRPETQYVPVELQTEPGVTANTHPKETAVDISKEQLSALATQVADILQPTIAALATNSAPAPVAIVAPAVVEPIVNSTAESAEVADAVAFAKSVRTNLVASLAKQGYSEAELASIPLNVLSKMAGTKQAVDFTALGAGNPAPSVVANDAFTPPSKTFVAKTA